MQGGRCSSERAENAPEVYPHSGRDFLKNSASIEGALFYIVQGNTMKNTVPFGARIAATWQSLVENLHTRTTAPAPCNKPYMGALAFFGEKALDAEDRNLLKREGCRAVILACIRRGIDTRDGIVRTVPRYTDCSHAWTAYLLDEGTGNDPAEHLWQKGSDKRYTLFAP